MVDRQFSIEKRSSVPMAPVAPTSEPKWISSETEDNKESKQRIKLYDNSSLMEKGIICLAEICGTAILVFMGCLSCVDGISDKGIIPIGFSFGLAIMIAVQTFGHISGSHVNPIVTVAAATLGNTPLLLIPVYITGQLLGGLAGFGLLRAVVPVNSSSSICSAKPNENLSSVEVMVIEFLLSLMLVWVCCGLWDARNNKHIETVPIKLGLTVAGLAFAGGPFTGGHMNPARTFGPSVINGTWKNHWMYWVGPLGAGLFGALLYRIVFGKIISDNESTTEEHFSAAKA